MPGIAGIVTTRPQETCGSTLTRMVSSLQHQRSDESALYSLPEFGAHIGMTSHAGSSSACVPIQNEDGQLALFLTGEVFDDQEVLLQLRRQGHHWDVGGARHLIHLYEELGERFFARVNGCCAGFLIDRRRRQCFLFNDRYGVQRLFVHEEEDAFYFASEAKALLAVLPATRAIDPVGLGQFVLWNGTLDGRSLFRNIQVLPAASLCSFERGRLATRARYFRSEPQRRRASSAADFEAQLVERLPRIVKRYVNFPFPLGMSLTGGLDSRMVMASMEGGPGGLECYTFGSEHRDTYDVAVARRVAAACGQRHHVIALGPEFRAALPHYFERAVHISDGYLGLSGAAELYANSQARLLAPVRITGNYGGELLRGDGGRNAAILNERLLTPEFSRVLGDLKRDYMETLAASAIPSALFQQTSWLGYGRYRIEQSQLLPRTPFLDNDLVESGARRVTRPSRRTQRLHRGPRTAQTRAPRHSDGSRVSSRARKRLWSRSAALSRGGLQGRVLGQSRGTSHGRGIGLARSFVAARAVFSGAPQVLPSSDMASD